MWRNAGVGGTWRKKHEPEVPERVQKKNWDDYSLRLRGVESWKQVKPGSNPEDERAEEKIYRQDVHVALSEIASDGTAITSSGSDPEGERLLALALAA